MASTFHIVRPVNVPADIKIHVSVTNFWSHFFIPNLSTSRTFIWFHCTHSEAREGETWAVLMFGPIAFSCKPSLDQCRSFEKVSYLEEQDQSGGSGTRFSSRRPTSACFAKQYEQMKRTAEEGLENLPGGDDLRAECKAQTRAIKLSEISRARDCAHVSPHSPGSRTSGLNRRANRCTDYLIDKCF